jgi:hypothetical protein|tara:strand:+ start:551 stop:835 length:285 start_codon:yes stop_codon:yes gene_type:complete
MKRENNTFDEIVKLLNNIHSAAAEYERLGLKPIDLIRSTDASQEMDFHQNFETDKYEFESMSWGEACHFVLLHSDYYSDQLKKFRVDPISKLHH